MRRRNRLNTLSVTVGTQRQSACTANIPEASACVQVAHVCTDRYKCTSIAALGQCKTNQNMQTVEANPTPNKKVYNKICGPPVLLQRQRGADLVMVSYSDMQYAPVEPPSRPPPPPPPPITSNTFPFLSRQKIKHHRGGGGGGGMPVGPRLCAWTQTAHRAGDDASFSVIRSAVVPRGAGGLAWTACHCWRTHPDFFFLPVQQIRSQDDIPTFKDTNSCANQDNGALARGAFSVGSRLCPFSRFCGPLGQPEANG